MGPQRRTQGAAASRAWTQRTRRQWRPDDVDSDPLTGARGVCMSRAVLRERLPGYVGQAILLAVVGWLVWRGVSNFEQNVRALGLSAGFGFLRARAGFELAQSLIAFSPASRYL